MVELDLTPTDDRPADVTAPAADPDGRPWEPGDASERWENPPQSEPADVPPEYMPVTEDEIRGQLDSLTAMLGMVLPVGLATPQLWDLDDREMDALAPPLTRVLNRRLPAAAAALQHVDEFAVAAQVGRYVVGRVGYLRSLEDEPEPDDAETVGFGLDEAGTYRQTVAADE